MSPKLTANRTATFLQRRAECETGVRFSNVLEHKSFGLDLALLGQPVAGHVDRTAWDQRRSTARGQRTSTVETDFHMRILASSQHVTLIEKVFVTRELGFSSVKPAAVPCNQKVPAVTLISAFGPS